MRLIPIGLFLMAGLCAQPLSYQKPSQQILDILNAPVLPSLSVNPTGTWASLSDSPRYPPISEVAAPMLRLAGIRINPRTNGRHLARFATAITLVKLPEATKTPLKLPADAMADDLRWSPDGAKFAFTNTTDNGIELWVGDPKSATAKKIDGVMLNQVLSGGLDWTPDSKTLLVTAIPTGRGPAPEEPRVPIGPEIQESDGSAMGVATYEDMLANPHDEDLFEYYATSQLVSVDVASGKVTKLGAPAMYGGVNLSPNGDYMMVSAVERPFSYLHPASQFPTKIEVWDKAGKMIYEVADLPLVERVPPGGTRPGPRNFGWIGSEPATVMWVEALDGGNPKETVPFRDQMLSIAAPFTAEPKLRFKTEERFGGIDYGKGFALISDRARETRIVRTFKVDLSEDNPEPTLVWSRNQQDVYADPGRPVGDRVDPVMLQSGNYIFLDGNGASPDGDFPFLDRFDTTTFQTERLFQSRPEMYETVAAVLSDDASRYIIRRESLTQPPNYFLIDAGKEIALTEFTDPVPQIRDIKKQLVTYDRADGVPLSMDLYLPPGYKEGTRLPAVVWAYPREYGDPETAGQIRGSQYRFTTISGYSQLFFLLAGYAVLDNATMPVVGKVEEMNDTYVEQIVGSAKAAIDTAAEMGYIDPDRVGVGGHSYGAFMTANLLAHSDLFKAGIAESGAYNRTLTPFGFQNEDRYFWDAKDTYLGMSPFMFANKVNEPLLLIHGRADNNSGTFPIQSERMYAAVRGNGGTVRLVFLPAESHGYSARETIEHVNWEKIRWFDMYVKGEATQPAEVSGQ